MKKRFIICLALLSAIFLQAETISVSNRIIASDRVVNDKFGRSVDIDGNYAIVGANGDDDGMGAAYIFFNNEGTWEQQQKLTASIRAASDYFGFSVGISGDWAIVGAYLEDEDANETNTLSSAGSVYIFHRSGNTWTQTQKIVPSDRFESDRFGFSVAMDGEYAIVGAYYADTQKGKVYFFHNNAGTWENTNQFTADDTYTNLGYSVDIHENLAVTGGYRFSSYDRTVHIYSLDGSSWTLTDTVCGAPDLVERFGVSVSIDENTAVVGAYYADISGIDKAGAPYFYINTNAVLSNKRKVYATEPQATQYFGSSVCVSGDVAMIGAEMDNYSIEDEQITLFTDAGSVYFYHFSGNVWTSFRKIITSPLDNYTYLGCAVALTADTCLAGAWGKDNQIGAAYIFNATDSSLPVTLSSFSADFQG